MHKNIHTTNIKFLNNINNWTSILNIFDDIVNNWSPSIKIYSIIEKYENLFNKYFFF